MTQTRLKTVWFFGICLVAITIMAIIYQMNGVALASSTVVGAIVYYYMKNETERPSKKTVDILNSSNNVG